ncbi:hypothetical protein JB92DRAFT_3132270 [Gautieria morchelliformis]|nr:hypothetical protein JB92DRAFT_3132270 [Gautieria morchelliformis]
MAHRSELAHDIMTIPGSAVTVEWIFSGWWTGYNILAVRESELAQTIRTLMIIKQSLKLAQVKMDE